MNYSEAIWFLTLLMIRVRNWVKMATASTAFSVFQSVFASFFYF